MTVEELDIIVQASVEQALTEFKKIVPQLKKTIKQVEENLNNVKTSGMVEKVQQAVQQVKQKVNEVKSTGIDKELQKQFEKAGSSVQKYQSELEQVKEKLRQVYEEMENIETKTWKEYTPEGVPLRSQAIEPVVSNALDDNKPYQNLSKEATKLENKMESLISKLNNTKQEYNKISGQIQEITSKQSAWRNAVNRIKSVMSSLKSNTENIRKVFSQIPNITTKINTKITQITKGTRQGLGHILKYAAALLSLESIYGMLSSSANAWLSSQNAQAQQLNANIEYLRWGFGSALAPVIEFVTNLVYNLLKAIQSLVYTLSGIDIFANASAKAYSSMADSANEANKATKQLAGVHNEINNISSNNSSSASGTGGVIAPTFDLTGAKKINSAIIDNIKNGNWYEIGVTLGEKLNEAVNSIPWSEIQEGAKKIGTNIAEFLNGFIANTDWAKIGNTLAQGINTAIYVGYNLVTKFDWAKFGKAIGEIFDGLFGNIDGKIAGKTLSNTATGILWSIINFLAEVDWFQIGKSIGDYLANIDWLTIIGQLLTILCEAVYALIMAVAGFIAGIFQGIGKWLYDNLVEPCCQIFSELWNAIKEIFSNVGQWFAEKFQQAYDGIVFIFQGIGQWFSERWNDICNVFNDIKNWFKTKFKEAYNGIVSVFEKIGQWFSDRWNDICNVFNDVKNWFKTKFKDAYEAITDVFSGIGKFFSDTWQGICNTTERIWNKIWGVIKNIANSILGGVEGMANGIVNGINAVIRVLNNLSFTVPDWIPGFGGNQFGFNISLLGQVSLPRLAKGAVLTVPTIAEMAEYPGASQNPEIVTPQNIMEETFDRVLAKYQGASSNDGEGIKQLIIQFGSHKVAIEMESLIRQARRRNGTASITI